MSIILQGSDGIKSTTFISDSTGKTIKIGMISFLPEHIDSFNLKIVSSGIPDTIDTTFIPTSTNTADTLWKSIIFSTPGTKVVTITPFSSNNPATVEANITIYGRVLIANSKPSITVSGKKNIVPGAICKLTIVTIDPDTLQKLTVSLSGNPDESYLIGDSLFIWESPETFSGDTSILFIVADNGTPPLSDTEKVTLTISTDTAVNQSPKWNPDVLSAAIGDTAFYSIDLAAMCSDPDSDQLTYTVLPGTPAKDTVIGSRYSFKATPEAIGRYNVNIVAVDPQSARDTLALTLTIESKASDTSAPVITLVAPAKDSGLSSSSAYTIDIICSDASGVASVGATIGGTTVPATRAAGHFTMAITGLPPNVYTAITITATDSSAKANKCTKVIFVKYGISFTLVYSGNGSTGGTVPVDTARYQAGAQVTVKNNSGLLVKTGSTFAGWNNATDGNGTSYDAGSTLVMGNANYTLFAKWSQKQNFTLTVTATNGSVTKAPDLATYDSGTVVTLTPVPAANYHFTGWSGALSGTANPATVTMSSAKSVTAGFDANQPNSYTLTLSATNGTVTKTPDLPQYVSGTSVSLKAIPKSGYRFVNWSGSGAEGTTDEIPVVMDAAKTITANFELLSYKLTVSKSGSGTTVPANPTDVNHGVETPVTATAAQGYEFASWTTSDAAATITNASSATAATVSLTGNATVTANFKLKIYTLSILKTGSGTTVPANSTDVGHAVETSLTATAAQGYEFVNWTTGDAAASITNASSATAATVSLTGSATLTANFRLKSYTLSILASGSGTTTPASSTDAVHSVATAITASPGAGYRFNGWSVTSGTATITDASSASTSVTLSSGNATVTANFARITYQLTVTAETGGTISTPSSPATVNHGTATTITATPGAGYNFNGWVVTSGSAAIPDLLSATTTATLTSGNATVKAQWTAIPYSITYTLNGGLQTGGSYPATYSVNTATITLPSPPKTAYVFDGWYDNSGFSGSKVTSIPTGSIGNKVLFAKWAIKDIDGNEYTEVKIGNQYWMVENFRCTTYTDNTPIPLLTDDSEWQECYDQKGACCFYNNSTDKSFRKKWGALYNQAAVKTGKLAPEGWRVATIDDWVALQTHLESKGYTDVNPTDDNSLAKALASTTDWRDTTKIGSPRHIQSKNNFSGFTALPAGMRSNSGWFHSINEEGWWWTSSPRSEDNSAAIGTFYDDFFGYGSIYPWAGFSVRLIRE